jgi:virginiamycin B lyase
MVTRLSMFNELQIRLIFLAVILTLSMLIHESSSQPPSLPNSVNTDQQLVTYQKQSNFIHEFDVPRLKDKGLKGIITDSDGNPWFYHQTNKTSTIIKFNLNNNFSSYPIEGRTVTDNSIINLAGGQLIYDEKRDSIWFTDARLNALGRINTHNGTKELYKIPTNNSGIMGLVLSPDNNSIWFTEIIGNNIGSFDINSKTIREYPTGELTGPTLLTFDSNGQLWVTMSYSSSILKVEPWMLVPGSRISGMFEIKLEKPDTFSPFGIAIANTNTSKLYISDHGSSRVVVSNLTSELKNYTSYWTSPSDAYPVSLPSQITSDEFGNIYFLEHGGNKISKISNDGLLTEYDIPTGPLATVVYLAVSSDTSKIWFTEWASNRIGYLDNTLRVQLDLKIINTAPEGLKLDQIYPLEIIVARNDKLANTPLSLNGIEVSITGMTESGLEGLTYLATPQRFNLTGVTSINGTMYLTVGKEATNGTYTIMPRVSTFEKNNLTVSLLRPQTVKLDVPVHKAQLQNLPVESNQPSSNATYILRDLARYGSMAVALTLVGYLAFRKIKQHRLKQTNK